MLDLGSKPFYLDEDGIRWVVSTRLAMSEEEKLRQLFGLITYSDDEEYCRRIGSSVRPGGFMSRIMPAEECRRTVGLMNSFSKIPLLVAANLEQGGNGVAKEGTSFASEMAVAATGRTEYARRLGHVCGTEARAVGVNWAFAPVVDIDFNFRNPITNTRTFGSDPATVAEMGRAYIEEIQKCGVAACAKHFPGDGTDERDQHIAPSVNSLDKDSWMRTYGRVYRSCIDAGVMSVMIGHISLPSVCKSGLPASLSREIVTDLLRKTLGFNGLVVTDSTTMAGFACAMPRSIAVPTAIAAGCDMFLFTKNIEEDVGFMLDGYKNGIISPERLDEAVDRILALKAALGMHKAQQKEEEGNLGSPLFSEWSEKCASEAITLVREEKGILPLTPSRYKRVLFYPLEMKKGLSVFNNDGSVCERFLEKLRSEGFAVTVFKPAEGFEGMMAPVSDITEKYDLIIYAANLQTKSNQTVVRIEWAPPMGADVPAYVHSVPTVFVSFANPYHLLDVPQIRTYINCYCGNGRFVDALTEKLTGRSPFVGRSPVNVEFPRENRFQIGTL